MRTMMVLAAAAAWSGAAAADVRIEAPPVVSGRPPAIRITGLPPRGVVRVHLFRMFAQWRGDDPARRTGWHMVPVPLHAWADLRADRRGVAVPARAAVTVGTYHGARCLWIAVVGTKAG